ncbi:DUF1275 domain-containing protein [Fodinisporobacter ferrooxydans]|uniref:DUF1275 domain-containing protein n=1 Tax=Fodinisporobacter ferrooxydans TaxID=2901836 RepID=A0ABY4CIM2_9BACL|nr:DUF1275 domain-containing protein [Alicyclobacillaceae bacterium MYW30-H2]
MKELIKLSRTMSNVLLVLLTMTSGCVDAIGFLALGQVFTAAMTGNTVLFGLAVVNTHGMSVFGYAVALLGFIVGAAAGAVILRRIQDRTGWNRTITASLCVELAALVLFAGIVLAMSNIKAQGAMADVLLFLLAFAMGVQGITARRIGVNGVTTTVITSTLTGLVETLVWKFEDSRLSTSSSSHKRDPVFGKKGNATSIASIVMWIAVIVFYGIGAAICGVFVHHWYLQAIWLPIAIVCIVIATSGAYEIRSAMERKTEISM